MRNLITARVALDQRINDMRSILRRASTPTFEIIYEHAKPAHKRELLTAIDTGSKDLFEAWLLNRRADEEILEAMSIRQLRDLGSRLGVKNYSRIQRHELIQLIIQKESQNGSVGKDQAVSVGSGDQAKDPTI